MLKTSYYLCLLFLVLGQLSILTKVGDSKVYIFDIAVILFGLFGTLYFLFKKTFKFTYSHFYFSLFILFALCSLIFSYTKFDLLSIFSGSMYLIRFSGYLLSGIVVFNMLKNGLISKKEMFYSIAISGLLLCIGGVIQLIVLPDFEMLDPSLGWDPHKNRLASTFFDPNFVGCYLSICLAVFFNKYYEQKKLSVIDIILFVFILVSIFLTFSRSAWAMLAVIIFIFGWFKSKTLLYVSLLVAFCAYFAVPRVQTRISGTTDPADSAKYRLESWNKAWQVAEKNLIIGVGFNNYKTAQKDAGFIEAGQMPTHSDAGADSSLLLVLATTGIMGLLSYLVGLVSPIFTRKKVSTLLLAVTGGLLINSLFINSLFYPQIMFLLFSIHSFSRT